MKRKCTDCKHVFVTSKKDKQVLLESLKLIGIKSICCGKCLSFYIGIENERQTQHLRGY